MLEAAARRCAAAELLLADFHMAFIVLAAVCADLDGDVHCGCRRNAGHQLTQEPHGGGG